MAEQQSKKSKIFITGVSGCVGHYLFDALVKEPGFHLYLLVRDSSKLMFRYSDFPNVTVLFGGLGEIEKYSELLGEMDYVVHLAAGWGDTETNYDLSIKLFGFLDPARMKKVIYFSTASILGSDNRLLSEAGRFGTPYIKGKYLCYQKLPELPIYNKIITLFPTWVLGGDSRHPYSHALEGIKGLSRWLWLLRFISLDIRFHFIHAEDIAGIVNYLLQHEVKERKLVLGNPVTTADQFINEVCAYFKIPVYFKIPLSSTLVKSVAGIFGKSLSEWDRFSLETRHFEYKTVYARTYGLPSNHEKITSILAEIIPRG